MNNASFLLEDQIPEQALKLVCRQLDAKVHYLIVEVLSKDTKRDTELIRKSLIFAPL